MLFWIFHYVVFRMVKCIDCSGLYLNDSDEKNSNFCISKNLPIEDHEENIVCPFYFSIPSFHKIGIIRIAEKIRPVKQRSRLNQATRKR